MGKLTKEDLERMRSIGFNPSGLVRTEKSKTVTLPSGERAKKTKDEAGNVVTERSDHGSVTGVSAHQDVNIIMQTVRGGTRSV